ncbi:MAG: alpha-L-fucosidase [Planctomycetes bacterium]|nr:alpha-L-fucosidase [Planctomycetota bacterium]
MKLLSLLRSTRALHGAALLGLVLASGACESTRSVHRKFPAPISQDERMAWWRDARFGMFIHWGLYAIPAGEWNGETGYGEWIRDSAQIPLETYTKFQAQFDPKAFDADAWAKMAADAGMKYLVITSKHHDGFCLFDSKETDWDVMNTPFKRDVLRELADACARHGVRFCTYHSIMDWHHPDYLPRRPWESRPSAGANFERFEKYLHAQVREVIEKYSPAVMWFDGEWESTWNHERGLALFELCRKANPAMIVNNRVDVYRGGMAGFSSSDDAVGDFATPEQEIPPTGFPGVDWESCMTMNGHWGFNRADKDFKSTKELVRNLIDIASKGGNYLLNVGPRADGTFPPESVQRLAEIGKWMDRYGSAIHGTTASVFDALDFGRCTVRVGPKKTKLFLHVFDWPSSRELVLEGLGNKVRAAYPLGDSSRELKVTTADGQVRVRVPEKPLDPLASVIVVEIDGAPIVYKAPKIVAETDTFVTDVQVEIEGATDALDVRYTLDGSEPVKGSRRYTEPLTLTETTVLTARIFHNGKAVGALSGRRFEKVAPRPAVEAAPSASGLSVERFVVDWDAIPEEFGPLVPVDTTVSPGVQLAGERDERVALRFKGFLDVPADELYRFALASDDGSKLWIDGELVVDNDGLHGTVEQLGAAPLAKGLHAFELIWFNKTGGAELRLRWAKPRASFEALPASAFRH